MPEQAIRDSAENALKKLKEKLEKYEKKDYKTTMAGKLDSSRTTVASHARSVASNMKTLTVDRPTSKTPIEKVSASCST